MAAVILLCPLTTAAKTRQPAWVTESPRDERYLYGIGVSGKTDSKESRTEAVAMGIASIATAVYSAVSESYEQTMDEGRTVLRDHLNLRTAHGLEGVEVVETSQTDRGLYALVRYPRASMPAARLAYAKNQRAAEEQARSLLSGGESRGLAARLRDLIHAVNLL